MVANEVVHHIHETKQAGLLLKLDLEKAYDSVDWGYLDDVIREMGFSVKWRRWIHNYISSNWVFVLVNGSSSDEFGVERGLRQGCSLSPHLLNIVAEGLYQLVCNAKLLRPIRRIADSMDGWNLNHLEYADNTLFFLRNDIEELESVKVILRWFNAFSGLKVNYHKSTLIG